MASTIITKNSSTASATPAVGDLQQGELAVNVTDKKVYTKDSSAAIVKLVGSLGNQEASAVAITGGSIAGITDLAVADGGTGSSTAAGARSNLSAAASGANSDITSLSGLTTALSVAQGGTGVTSSTGSGSVVLSNSPTLVTPALGTPSAAVLTNATGLPLSTGISGLGTGVATFLGTPSSANLLAAVTDETGTGALVFANSPTLVTPALGTPASATLTNATGLPIGTGVSGLGTGVATALAVNVGSAGAPVVNGGVLGTPSSGTLTNATGLPISTGVSGLGTGVATALAVNVGSAGAPVVNGGALGTPSSGTVTNLTGTASININGTVGATTPTTGAFTTLSASGAVTLSGGTANGVTYLNGSKVLTSGSALTFDGTKLTIGSTTANAKFNVNTTTYTAVTNGEQVLIEGTGAWQQGLAFSMWSAGLYNSNYASGYIGVPNTTNELFISGGAAVVNNTATGGWAKALNTTSASFMVVGGGNTTFYGNTGLTANTTYTPTELLRLTSTSLYTASGINVGIGTSSPSQKLEVSSGAAQFNGGGIDGTFGDAILFGNSSFPTVQKNRIRSSISAGAESNLLSIETSTATAGTYNSNQLVLRGDGNVGIGTSSPQSRLEVRQDQSGAITRVIANNNFANTGAGSSFDYYFGTTRLGGLTHAFASGAYLGFDVWSGSSATERMRITSAGDVGIGVSSPSNYSGWTTVSIGNTAGGEIDFYSSGTNVSQIYGGSVGTYISSIGGRSTIFTTNGLERARIDSAGNVGIGTSSPSTKLHIVGANTANRGQLSVQSDSAGNEARITLYDGADNIGEFGTSGTSVYAYSGGNLLLYAGSSERARIDSSGNFLINCTSVPSGGSNSTAYDNTGDESWVGSSSGTGGSYKWKFYNGNGLVGSIVTSGSSTAFNTSSDYRLKENIAPMTGALATVEQLKPCTYTWKADGSNGQGFIAHELQEVVPDAVVGEKDAVDADGNIKPQGIDTSFLVATLTAALQELNAKFDAYVASHP